MDKEGLEWISRLTRKDVITLPNDFIKMCHNEYNNRWRRDNKDKWNAIRRQNAKKYRNNITQGKTETSNNITKTTAESVAYGRQHE